MDGYTVIYNIAKRLAEKNKEDRHENNKPKSSRTI